MILILLVVTIVLSGCGSKKTKSAKQAKANKQIEKHLPPKIAMSDQTKTIPPQKEEESAVTITPVTPVKEEPTDKNPLKKAREAFLADIKPLPKEEVPGVIVLAHFNGMENKTELGDFGAWDKDPQDMTQMCEINLISEIKRGDKGKALEIKYDVDSDNPAFNGVWFKLNDIDLSEYKALVFWAKGDVNKGASENFKVELKTDQQVGLAEIMGITTEWKQFILPLDKFVGISGFDSMKELIFVFEDWAVSDKEGVLFVDDIYFIKEEPLAKPLCDIYGKVKDKIIKPDISQLSDNEYLELIQRKSFAFFWNECNPENGLVRDKANNFWEDESPVASIASVAFALSSYPIAIEKGWITREEGLERTLRTLRYFKNEIVNVKGFFYHFINMDSGKRAWNCEVSSVDTALFIAGALLSGEYFEGEVKTLAEEIYHRVDWDWMMDGGDAMCMKWTPENEFFAERWNQYGEELIMYLLAIGSPTHAISPSVWDKIKRPVLSYKDYTTIVSPPLFTHQYSHIWIDFRNKHDKFVDYFEVARQSTLANRQFCIDSQHKYKTFNENSWGLTACMSATGYRVFGAPPGYADCDGTVAFTGPGASVPFAPEECISALRAMYEENDKEQIWGRYGFVDSFNLEKNWYCDSIVGIDQGAMLLMIENYLTQMPWNYFMKIKDVRKAMNIVGFKDGTIKLKKREVPLIRAKYGQISLDFDTEMSGNFNQLTPDENLESGSITQYPEDLAVQYQFKWDDTNLYLWAEVKDAEVIADETAENLYRKDCLELYFAPNSDRLEWGIANHFQLGFAPSSQSDTPIKYAWFQNKDFEEIKMNAVIAGKGYQIKAMIPFAVLGVEPEKDLEISFSFAVHDVDDSDKTNECKYVLYFVPLYEGGSEQGFELAKLKLVK